MKANYETVTFLTTACFLKQNCYKELRDTALEDENEEQRIDDFTDVRRPATVTEHRTASLFITIKESHTSWKHTVLLTTTARKVSLTR